MPRARLAVSALTLVLTLVLLAALPVPTLPQVAPHPPASPTRVHLVKSGDTLSAIAARHGVTVTLLVATNRLASPGVRLRVGQRLTIPGGVRVVSRSRRAAPATTVRHLPSPPRTLVLAVPDFAELVPLFTWPVEGQVSSTFGRRRMGWHRGIDIKADLGAAVAAAAPGTVVSSTYETRYGRVIKIGHINGFITVYAHNDHNLVEIGERVGLGQIIAAVGRTGRATSPHVHFEIRQAGLAYNPLYMLPLPRLTQIAEGDEDEPEDVDE